MRKYTRNPTNKQIQALKIFTEKDKKGNIKGFTVWSDGRWVLDASTMKDDKNVCKIHLGFRHTPLQFEYYENVTSGECYLILKAEKRVPANIKNDVNLR
jgi:hypothetical protein